jgi:predicted NUDIX family NTP pyrophosphohydrolase
MGKKSAGILVFRRKKEFEVMLVHPGGPFWKNKDAGAWSIPKGEFTENEDPLEAAKRELKEETGIVIEGKFIQLEPVTQKGGKHVYAWAINRDLDISTIKSNSFELEWPPRSGKKMKFDEVDKAEWFDLASARKKINPAQTAFIDQLERLPGNI